MDILNFIIIGVAVGFGIFLVRFITKSIKALFTIGLIIFGVLVYFFYFSQDENRKQEIRDNVNSKISLVQLKKTACSGKLEKKQQIRCDCFVSIIYDELRTKYSDKEIEDLTTQKGKMIFELTTIVAKKSGDIKTCLRENDALEMWDEIMKDIKSGDLFDKMNDAVKNVSEKADINFIE